MLEVRFSGKFEIQYDGKSVILASRAAQSLFAYLILTAGTLHRREKLAGMMWPDESEEKARTYLRNELWRIRKALSPTSKVQYLMADNLTIGFDPSSAYWLDVTAFKNIGDSASADELITGLSYYEHELLPGFYEDWIVLEREHLQVFFEQKIACLLEMLEKEKRWDAILEWAERWISFVQAPEAAYRMLMVAYDALGDQTKVASTYERCKEALRQLDLEPSEETRALAFKRYPKINIPIPLTSFIGREKELKEVAGLFSKSRLITLTGSGGVGKTRLAIQVVAETLDLFPDGVWFLDLASLTDPALIPNTLANLLGLRGSGEIPVTQLLINYFHTRTALVIFDNCEHLIDASAQLIHSLLTSCEHTTILATSRETLRVSGEIPYRVPSLEIPEPNTEFDFLEISSMEAVKLFVERAAVASQPFILSQKNVVPIAQICQRLDGIPLALELAAARVSVLTVEQILKRLDDRFNLLTGGLRTYLPRHQTLRATIEWSHELLSEKERVLFRRLAVFVGGWTLEAAQEVCSDDGLEPNEILELISQLVNKSLMAVENSYRETRYRRLETIRQFAREKFMESGEGELIRQRHANWFVELAEQAEPKLRGPEQFQWLDRIEQEHNNFRVALEWSLNNNIEAGLRIGAALVWFWDAHDHCIEGVQYMEKLLAAEPNALSLWRANAFARSGYLAALAYDLTSSPSYLEKMSDFAQSGLKVSRQLNFMEGEAFSLLCIALSFLFGGDINQGLLLAKRSLGIFQQAGIQWGMYRSYTAIAFFEHAQGNYEKTTEAYRSALLLSRQAGDLNMTTFLVFALGRLAVEQGHYEEAEALFQESLPLARQAKNKHNISGNLQALGDLYIHLKQYAQARDSLEECVAIQKVIGDQEVVYSINRLGRVACLQGHLEQANKHYEEGLRLAQKYDSRKMLAWCLIELSELAALNEQPVRAASLLGALESLPELRIGLLAHERLELEKVTDTVRSQLDGEAYAAAYEAGKRMSLEEAVSYALKEL
jgi:non-specific serine/threonine protein kinase